MKPQTPRSTRWWEDPALRTALIYAAVAGVWILVSDSILGWFVSDPLTLTRIATLKGWVFVGVTSLMLFGFIRRDIAAIRRVELQLRQVQRLESLGLLAGGIAHDFNNLLTAMVGNLNLAQKELPPGSGAIPYLENAEKTVLKASDLAQQMLAFAGRRSFHLSALDVNQVVREMSDLLQVSIPKGVELQCQLAEDLPAILGDRGQVQQVVMNLVTNASDAMGEASGTIALATYPATLDESTVKAMPAGQNLRPGAFSVVEVRDTGCGMSPEVLARIFDPFFTTKKTGRGLGLSTMLGILVAHGAGIAIDTKEGIGTTFRLFFPAQAGLVPKPQTSEPERSVQFSGRVLLVDDEPVILESTEGLLSSLGFTVVSAIDGVDAVARFEREPGAFALVLMDLTMPRMNGHEAFERIRAIRRDVPVILCSGYTERELSQEFRSQRLTGFLQKPYRMAELKRAIQTCLARA